MKARSLPTVRPVQSGFSQGMPLVAGLLVLLSLNSALLAEDADKSAGKQDKDKPSAAKLEKRERAFIERMSNSVLVGHFTLVGEENNGGKPERYEIREINKVSGNMWVFQTRVKYGQVDSVLPIPVPIEWAGDTPMVSMTNFTIPGMGTFSCRVLFDNDRYAGTWQHGKKGGHMWGLIEKAEKSAADK